MSNSMCMQDRSPLLCNSRFTLIAARNGFLASNGLRKNSERKLCSEYTIGAPFTDSE
jgi:hypothetical protein